MARRRKSSGKGGLRWSRRDSTLRLVWHQFADSFEDPFPPLDWHSTLASGEFSRFSSGLPKRETRGFRLSRSKGGLEGVGYGRLPRFDEDIRDSRNRPLNFPFNLGVHDSHPGSRDRLRRNAFTLSQITRYICQAKCE